MVALPACAGERDVIVAPARGVHLGAVEQEKLGHLCVSAQRREHERAETLLSAVFDVRLPLEKEFDDLLVSLPAGEGEGTVLVAVRLHVDLGRVVQQELGDPFVAGQGGKHEGRAAVFGAVFHARLSLQQEGHYFFVPQGAGPRESAVVRRLGWRVDVRPPIEKQLGDGHVALATSFEKRRVACLVPVIHVRAALEKQFDNILLPLATS